ncbi:MBL fold metallo-hydrolase [Kiloniella litopenaei]|uniref:MBL fold metallo-hydrolase n=1 Tax=Kiloniella litopenaei TaxID=1549748 RepID=UPI003BA9FE5C
MTLSRRELLKGSLLTGGAGLVASMASLSVPMPGFAAAPKAGVQTTGAYRFSVGNFEITALLDGYIDAGSDLIPNYDPQEAAQLYRDQFRTPPVDKIRVPINSFVVNTGEKIILIDSGTADNMGPTLGQFTENLKAAGITPESVDAILLTHMHVDHISGITSKEGKAHFPNAELIVHKKDWDFWHDDAYMSKASDFLKTNSANAKAMSAPYAKRLTLIDKDGEVLPGIEAVALPGHTPGHTGFVLRSEGQEVLIWGDLVHFTALQFQHPEWSIAFDIDMQQAEQTRRRMLDWVSADRVAVLGSHLEFPGLGHVAQDKGAYRYYQSSWQYQL